LADQLRALVLKHTDEGTSAAKGEVLDGIQDRLERRHFTPEAATGMSDLCGRAMIANLRFLRSLRRKDPPDK